MGGRQATHILPPADVIRIKQKAAFAGVTPGLPGIHSPAMGAGWGLVGHGKLRNREVSCSQPPEMLGGGGTERQDHFQESGSVTGMVPRCRKQGRDWAQDGNGLALACHLRPTPLAGPGPREVVHGEPYRAVGCGILEGNG